jgi:cytochrome o ubiquinol oxidase subunit 3
MQNDKTQFGFWVYLMSDCLLFAALFATYAVLRGNNFGGPSEGDLFSLPFVLVETIVLLTSSFTSGLALMAVERRKKRQTIAWFSATFVLGVTFLSMELYEFTKLFHEGASWTRSGFLSAFFTLVGTHGLHIAIGLLWMIIILMQVGRKGITETNARRLTLLGLFWHFLDVIWIFIFTMVYLLGII